VYVRASNESRKGHGKRFPPVLPVSAPRSVAGVLVHTQGGIAGWLNRADLIAAAIVYQAGRWDRAGSVDSCDGCTCLARPGQQAREIWPTRTEVGRQGPGASLFSPLAGDSAPSRFLLIRCRLPVVFSAMAGELRRRPWLEVRGLTITPGRPHAGKRDSITVADIVCGITITPSCPHSVSRKSLSYNRLDVQDSRICLPDDVDDGGARWCLKEDGRASRNGCLSPNAAPARLDAYISITP
jgi:hypothetical protein